MPQLQEVQGVGPATATALADHGLGSVKKLGRAKVKAVAKVPGFGRVRARAVRDAARTHGEPKADPRKAKKAAKKNGKAKAAKLAKGKSKH